MHFETAAGIAQVHPFLASQPRASLVLAHGAGRGTNTGDLQALAAKLPELSISVYLVDQPWVLAGRKVAASPKILDAVHLAVLAELDLALPLFVGGRSAGARSMARVTQQHQVTGYLGLAFPLHPPGRPEASRVAEILAVSVPKLILQGDRDNFGKAAEFPPELPVRPIPFADHSFKVPKSAATGQAEIYQLLVDHTAAWVNQVLG